MAASIIHAFDVRIDRLAWMTPRTKQEPKAKLETLKGSVGYPDTWPSDAGLEVVPGRAYGNFHRVEHFPLMT
jgi:putative endopeptidase